MIRKLAGFLLILSGSGLGAWILFNLLIELRPEAKALSPAPALILSVGMIIFGLWKITDGSFVKDEMWRNRGFHKGALAGTGLVFLGYCMNVYLRLSATASKGLDFWAAPIADLIALCIILGIFVRLLVLVFSGERN
jgi:hypothetical protein